MNPDPRLSSLLQSWQPDRDSDFGFNRSVWSRIEAAESRRPALISPLFSWFQALSRPRIAMTAAAVALFGGVLIGGVQARSAQEERYIGSLNPYSTRR